MTRYTVREYLDAPLPPTRRLAALDQLLDRFAGQTLDHIVTDLRSTLAGGPVSMEDFRRLHILISRLYHDHDADLPLTRDLRDEVGQARARHRARPDGEGGDDRVLLEPGLPEDGLPHRPAATADRRRP